MAAGLPSAVLVEIEFTAGAWTDVSSLVKGNSLEIHVGRDSAASGIQPGTLDLDLDNSDGRFTPDNPLSTYYPNLVEGKRIRVRVTKSASTYVRFVGRITSLVPDFPMEPTQSVTHVAAVDLLGDLARTKLPTVPEAYARTQSVPFVFYALAESTVSTGFPELRGSSDRLVIREVTSGTGTVTAGSDSSLDDGKSYVALTAGKALWHASPTVSSGVYTGGWFITFMVNVNASSLGTVLVISDGPANTAKNFHTLKFEDTSGTPCLTLFTSLGSSSYASVPIPVDDGWHHVYVDDTGTFAVDGGSTSTTSQSVPMPTCLSLGGDIDMSVGNLYMVNAAGTFPAANEVLLTTSPGTLTSALALLQTCTRVAGLSGTYAWSTSPSNLAAPPQISGRSALDALLDIANSASGVAYHEYSTSATQTVRVLHTADSKPTAVALTIDAEGDLVGGPEVMRDILGVIAEATVTSTAGSVTVRDETVTIVGAANASLDTLLVDTNDQYAVATALIAAGRDQKLRVSRLTVDLANATNDRYAAFFAVTPNERLRLTGLPSTYFGVTYMDGYIEGWTERPSVDGYEVTFDLSPADAPPEAYFDDSTYGRFGWGDGVCTASSLTSSATSVTLTWTGSATLSTSAGDYPMDIEIAGERCTITSAPAGGTSPRTVTITRGVAPTVARAHTAGDAVEVWNAARFAL